MTVHPLVTEVSRPISHAELLELAPAPLRGLPRVGATPDRSIDEATLARIIATAPDPFQACRVGFLYGCMREQWPDFDPRREVATALVERAPALVMAAAKASRVLVRADEPLDRRALVERVGIRWDPGLPALLGAHLLSMAMMTVLARDEPLRARARADATLRGATTVLSEAVVEAEPLRVMLDTVDQLDALVLHPEQRRGFMVRAERVRNGFQLFALLDELLLGADEPRPLHGPIPAPEVGALARGEPVELGRDRLSSAHGFYNWSAWTADGLASDRATRLLWGELPIHRIPPLTDTPVVLMGTPWLDRGWPPALVTPLHPAYRPRTQLLQTLDAEQVAPWLARIEAAAASEREALRYATQ